MDTLIHNLLCKRKRRLELILYWHSDSIPFEAETNLLNIIYRFINIILYDPVQVSMHADYFYVLRELKIPYALLTAEEREIVKNLFSNRCEYFGSCEFYVTNYKLTRYRQRLELSMQHRREIVRDFIGLLFKKHYQCAVLHVIQRLLIEKSNDLFLIAVHEVLQGRTKLSELLCV